MKFLYLSVKKCLVLITKINLNIPNHKLFCRSLKFASLKSTYNRYQNILDVY